MGGEEADKLPRSYAARVGDEERPVAEKLIDDVAADILNLDY